jgi:inosose dehydratase
MPVRLACQTIVFGKRASLLPMLDAVAETGYRGVEFFQTPAQLGPPETVRKELARRDLVPVMIAGKTPLSDKIAFARECGVPYVYTKGRDLDRIGDVEEAGLRFALHPHLNAPVERLADAETALKRHPTLMFAPDVAHIAAAGDEPEEAIRHNASRIVSIHIKDWKPGWGTNPFTAPLGFREPGQGILPLDRYLEVIRNVQYDGWLTIEVERCPRNDTPRNVLARSRDWLQYRGF